MIRGTLDWMYERTDVPNSYHTHADFVKAKTF